MGCRVETKNANYCIIHASKAKDDRLSSKHFLTGVVTSPNYPGDYPNNLEKTETVRVELGLVLSLQFTSFDIEYSASCDYDHLKITDGDGTTLMEKTCGSSLPGPINSRSNLVNIVFITDKMDSRSSGWSLSWSAKTLGEYLFSQNCMTCQQLPLFLLLNKSIISAILFSF